MDRPGFNPDPGDSLYGSMFVWFLSVMDASLRPAGCSVLSPGDRPACSKWKAFGALPVCDEPLTYGSCKVLMRRNSNAKVCTVVAL